MSLCVHHEVTQRPPDGKENLSEQPVGQPAAQWASGQKVSVERCDLLAEEDTGATKPSNTCRDGNTRRSESASREDWDHNQVVAQAVPNILRDDESWSWLMGVIWLAGCVDKPDLATPRRPA
jgi:hypothetical protein